MEYLDRLNRRHRTIKFTSEIDRSKAVFLDTRVYKGDRFRRNGVLDIETHFKATNKFQYLHYESSHPRATAKAVVLGECHRFLRSTSDPQRYAETVEKHTERLQRRGYPGGLTRRLTDTVPFSRRTEILDRERKRDDHDDNEER